MTKEEPLDSQILEALGVDNGELYVDTKAKHLVEDIRKLIQKENQKAVLTELRRLSIAFYDDHPTFNGDELTKRIAELESLNKHLDKTTPKLNPYVEGGFFDEGES